MTTNTDSPAVPRQRDDGPRYDLRGLFRAGHVTGPPTSATPRRVVRPVETHPRDVRGAAPLPVAGFVDGVQSRVPIRHVDHRPVTLAWVAAGAVTRDAQLLAFRQHLTLIASEADADVAAKLSEAGAGVPVHLLGELTPWGVQAATQAAVDAWRRELEREVVTRAPVPDGSWLVVDGPIRHYQRDRLAGIVKAVEGTQYLPDERVLPGRAGWRSPAFELPPTTTAERSVVSCYLRLHDAPGSVAWSHGLIRPEAPDLEALDAVCALALRERQGPGSGDPRWACHLAAMHRTEEVLRSFRPYALEP